MTDATLARTPLHERHEALGAKFAEFGGWSMPLQYSGVVDEHTAVRERVGLFDVSHLGKASVTGPGAREFVNSCLSNDLDKIGPGQAQYTLCCDESGGVVDDLIIYLRADDDLLLVPNAANNAEVVRRLAAEAPAGVDVRDQHREFAVMAIQGPRSERTVAAAGLPTEHPYMSFVEADFDGVSVTVCRTGYTGERGYELVVPWDAATAVWDALLRAGESDGIAACGLGARDTLRTDMGYPLHGQDLSLEISPLQGRSSWAVGWSKERFWGRAALLAEKEAGPARRLRGIRALGRGIPRPGMTVTVDSDPVGTVTSGTFSPTLRQGVGLALLPPEVTEGSEVAVQIRNRTESFEVVRPPFVQAGSAESA
ncbi:aminomethyltransferase [Haloactinopolyspora alba]|uniref:Aminomethyltransferase n=1 Tax=Haloactinopolyspora alba TaxID=648780 RepID=A0A2P8DR97_9ACTN|nr:glycine cleavage system aminomethyltransferase GcvT [Haloactinopolyspora alba]PSK99735.1 aminomethyltransferase [Haloactinopolyspora alba]